VQDILAEATGEVVRLALLGTHYRDPLDWTADRLLQASQTLDRFYRALALPSVPPVEVVSPSRSVSEALDDDLNVPMAMARMHVLLGAINRIDDQIERGRAQSELAASAQLMGLLTQDPFAWRQNQEITGEEILKLLAERAQARKERRFADADRIRDDLAARGIGVEDRPDAPSIAYRMR